MAGRLYETFVMGKEGVYRTAENKNKQALKLFLSWLCPANSLFLKFLINICFTSNLKLGIYPEPCM